MPLVAADGRTPDERLASRIRNHRRLLTVAAIIMSFYLLASSFVTTLLIPRRRSRRVARPTAVPWPTGMSAPCMT